jgi:hypothetical protein
MNRFHSLRIYHLNLEMNCNIGCDSLFHYDNIRLRSFYRNKLKLI